MRCLKSTSPPPEALSSPICGSPDIVIVYAARAVPASAVAAADSAISAVSVVGAGPVGDFAAAWPQPAASAAPRIRVASRRGDTHSTYTPLAASAIPQSGGRRLLSDEPADQPAALRRLGCRLDRGGRGDLADLPAVLLDVALVVVLGRPEGRGRDDLRSRSPCRDGSGRRHATPPRPGAAPRSGRRSRSGTASRCPSPGGPASSGCGCSRRARAAARTTRRRGRT